MLCIIAPTFTLSVLLLGVQVEEKSQNDLFTVEFVRSPTSPKMDGPEIQLALGRGFVDKSGRKISNKCLKEAYLIPSSKKADCILRIQFHESDKLEMTVEYLFKHIDMIRELRDKKIRTRVYIIAN